jgi:hypothetical protein
MELVGTQVEIIRNHKEDKAKHAVLLKDCLRAMTDYIENCHRNEEDYSSFPVLWVRWFSAYGDEWEH